MICMLNKIKSHINLFRCYELFYIVLLVFFDYISKYLFATYLVSNKINILWDYIFLELFKNKWVAFSIELPFLKVLTLIIITWIIYYYIKFEKYKKNRYIDLSYILIISWALWNARERIIFWEVTDFIWVKYFSIFNFADIYINLGIIFYLAIIVLKKDKVWL